MLSPALRRRVLNDYYTALQAFQARAVAHESGVRQAFASPGLEAGPAAGPHQEHSEV